MRALKTIAMVLLAIVVGFTAIGLVLPRDMKVERSTVVHAPRGTVYARIVDVSSWRSWLLGPAVDPRCTFSAAADKLSWDCEGTGGSLSIVDRDEEKAVWIEALLPGAVEKARMTFSLEDAPNGTKVTWLEEARAPGLVGGWLTPFFRRARGDQIDVALQQLAVSRASP